MIFRGKILLPLRQRLLLALIAAAGAGVFLTYSGLKKPALAFAMEETGERLFLRLTLYAETVEKEILSSIGTAGAIAGRAGLREPLTRLGAGSGRPEDRDELKSRLAEAAALAPSITALQLVDAHGAVAASSGAIPRARGFSQRSRLSPQPGGVYVGFPSPGGKAPEYEVTVPVTVPGRTGRQARIGELRCLFKGARPPSGLRESVPVTYTLAERRGNSLKVSAIGGPREIAIASEEAAPFLSALEGKEGFSIMNAAGEKRLYAYRRLSVSDWILTAAAPYTAAAASGESMLGAASLNALLSFAFLAIAAFLAADLVLAPVTEAARAARSFLEEYGTAAPATGTYRDMEFINKALAEAGSMAGTRGRSGAALETETEKLREEDADLKYQNSELEKLNKYLLDREIKISELKKEISELKERFTRETAE